MNYTLTDMTIFFKEGKEILFELAVPHPVVVDTILMAGLFTKTKFDIQLFNLKSAAFPVKCQTQTHQKKADILCNYKAIG